VQDGVQWPLGVEGLFEVQGEEAKARKPFLAVGCWILREGGREGREGGKGGFRFSFFRDLRGRREGTEEGGV
jgi:hypothetical protein